MRERPILFSAPMVRAILDGRKTMTRRVIKSHPFIGCGFTDEYVKMPENHLVDDCPYGTIGDRLWVRETWAPHASRIDLEITGIRVERVQDISDADAFAEGIQQEVDEAPRDDGSARGAFRTLWDSINAKRGFGWDVNPWVWAISFRRLS